MDFDEMASMTEEQKKALIKTIIKEQGMPLPPGPGLDPSGKRLNAVPARGPMLAGGMDTYDLNERNTATDAIATPLIQFRNQSQSPSAPAAPAQPPMPFQGSPNPPGTVFSPQTMPTYPVPGAGGFRGPTGFALAPQPTPAAPPPVHSTGVGGLEPRIHKVKENPFVAPRGGNIPDENTLPGLIKAAYHRVTRPAPAIPNAPSWAGDKYVEKAIMMGSPLGRTVAGIGTLKGMLPGPKAFTTSQRTSMGTPQGVVTRSRTNTVGTGPWGTNEPPLGFTGSLRRIHDVARRGQTDRARETRRQENTAAYSDVEKLRVRQSSLKARKSSPNRTLGHVKRKGRLDQDMSRIFED